MTLPRKLTTKETALRAELVELDERIRLKIRKITWTHQKLPYDRLAKGRVLKETVLTAIELLDKGDDRQLAIALDRLEALGIELKNG